MRKHMVCDHAKMRKIGTTNFAVIMNGSATYNASLGVEVHECETCCKVELVSFAKIEKDVRPAPCGTCDGAGCPVCRPVPEPDCLDCGKTPCACKAELPRGLSVREKVAVAPDKLSLARIAELIGATAGTAWHRNAITDGEEAALQEFAEKLTKIAEYADRPLRFRFARQVGQHEPSEGSHPADARWQYGCYFPRTDLCVTDMGARGTGRPNWPGVEWLDE